MIEAKTSFFIQRIFARTLSKSDWRKAVLYNSYLGNLDNVPFYYIKRTEDHSCQTDLTKNMDDILANMNKHMRSDIRKAEKMGCVFKWGYFYDEFIPFYRKFASKKGIDSNVSLDRITRYGKPIVTKVSFEGKVLAMHVRVVDKENRFAMALYASNARFDEGVNPQIAGRANKFLQYKDLELLKSWGIETYDWAGVDIDKLHKERFSIGEYKLAYGAVVVPSPTVYTPLYGLLLLCRNLATKPIVFIRNIFTKVSK